MTPETLRLPIDKSVQLINRSHTQLRPINLLVEPPNLIPAHKHSNRPIKLARFLTQRWHHQLTSNRAFKVVLCLRGAIKQIIACLEDLAN